jgi:phytanoyl-CoA hydroxylase
VPFCLPACLPACLQDSYFLDSVSQVSFFFEEKAFLEDGQLRQAKELSINKLGHAMHDLDPVFR